MIVVQKNKIKIYLLLKKKKKIVVSVFPAFARHYSSYMYKEIFEIERWSPYNYKMVYMGVILNIVTEQL